MSAVASVFDKQTWVNVAKGGWHLAGHPHTALFALQHANKPGQLIEAKRSFEIATAMEVRLFGTRTHADDGVDALRHAFAAALLAYRLITEHGESARSAIAFTVGAGDAHERDGNDGGETRNSSRMDRHNNAVGARIGARLARARGTPSSAAILAAVRGALALGELQTLGANGRPRPARLRDLIDA